MYMTTSNVLNVGASGYVTNLLGSSITSTSQLSMSNFITLGNTWYLQAKESGGTARNIVGIDGSNITIFGNASNSTRINSNGTLTHNGTAILQANAINGSFTTTDGKTITVVNGQITAIV
jgi:hypothetical protein